MKHVCLSCEDCLSKQMIQKPEKGNHSSKMTRNHKNIFLKRKWRKPMAKATETTLLPTTPKISKCSFTASMTCQKPLDHVGRDTPRMTGRSSSSKEPTRRAMKPVNVFFGLEKSWDFWIWDCGFGFVFFNDWLVLDDSDCFRRLDKTFGSECGLRSWSGRG